MIKNDEKQSKTMKNVEKTMKNDGKQRKTMKNNKKDEIRTFVVN